MNINERGKPCDTNTQHKINLSGYQWAMKQLGDLGGKTVLDNACGTGYGSSLLAEKAAKVIGIDIAREAIEYCTKNFKKNNVEYRIMNAESLVFADDYFDVVISQDTIEHVLNDHAFLKEIHRVLKKDGTLIIFTAHGKGRAIKPKNIYHHREYTKDEFNELLSNYFEKISFYGRKKSDLLTSVEDEMNRVRKLDLFHVRKIVPRYIRHSIGSFLVKRKTGKSLADISFKDIEYIEGVRENASLIAVCRK